MVETITYVRKPFEVEAVQVTEENMLEVASWCKGQLASDEAGVGFIKVDVARPMNRRQTMAYFGDWVLFANGGFKVYTQKAFEKTFEQKAANHI